MTRRIKRPRKSRAVLEQQEEIEKSNNGLWGLMYEDPTSWIYRTQPLVLIREHIAELRIGIHKAREVCETQQAEIARLNDLWFEFETIAPDGELRPQVGDLAKELARLREVEKAALAQSEYIQSHGLTEYEMAKKNAAYALALDKIRDQESEIAKLRKEADETRKYLESSSTSARKEL